MSEPCNHRGLLYVVATPIGNLGDMTQRAVEVLQQVDCIAAEDTRHSGPLLRHFAISTPVMAYHEHNERALAPVLVARMLAGERIALISDAGTPLLSDPGFQLVCAARDRGVTVVPIPGANAVACALSACGLPCDRFVFEGFLPAKQAARHAHLESLRGEARTLVFYESPHRVADTLADLATAFGGERRAVLVRELTKIHETFLHDTLHGLITRVATDANQRRGECTLVVEGAPQANATLQREAQARAIFELLAKELPASRAVALAAQIAGTRKNALYSLVIADTPSG